MARFARKGWKVVALAGAIVLIPTAASAVIGTFTNTTAAPAVTGTNSSAAANAAGVSGANTGGGLNTRYGVVGSANGAAGVGMKGTGTKFGVQSVGPFNATGAATLGSSLAVAGAANLKNTTITGTFTQTGAATHNGAVIVNGTTALNDNATIAAGKTLTCTGCVSPGDLSSGVGVRAKARISSNATVVTSTPGVTVTSLGTGAFCVQFPVGVVTGDEVVVVSPDFALSPSISVETQWDGPASCVGGATIITFGGPLAGPLAQANEGFDLIVT